MDDARAWQGLRDRFIEAALRPDSDPRSIWLLVIEHPWYSAALRRIAGRAIRGAKLPADWLPDVMQEAISLLAEDLECNPDLGFDFDQAGHRFDGWLATIIFHQCGRAVRGLRRLHPAHQPLEDEDLAVESLALLEARLEVRDALTRIEEPYRTILILFAELHSVRAIAEHVSISRRAATRALEHGLHLLAQLLDSHGDR